MHAPSPSCGLVLRIISNHLGNVFERIGCPDPLVLPLKGGPYCGGYYPAADDLPSALCVKPPDQALALCLTKRCKVRHEIGVHKQALPRWCKICWGRGYAADEHIERQAVLHEMMLMVDEGSVEALSGVKELWFRKHRDTELGVEIMSPEVEPGEKESYTANKNQFDTHNQALKKLPPNQHVSGPSGPNLNMSLNRLASFPFG